MSEISEKDNDILCKVQSDQTSHYLTLKPSLKSFLQHR
jgi:hypothetical protein